MDYNFCNLYLLNQLETIDTEELMATPYAPKNFIVAEMLPEGLTLLCGPSKIGKSWLVLQLCICVSLGVRFMGFNTQQCDVLYLTLEDTLCACEGASRTNHRRLPESLALRCTGRNGGRCAGRTAYTPQDAISGN